jgi:MHS family shikimate/dehydroshikimate transporter-like MFS transporter
MLVGLIPTYDQIGVWAAVLLVLLRILQGIAIGGEWGGAVLMAVEHSPDDKKGLFGSLPQAGIGVGLVLSSLAMGWTTRLSEADLLRWGWRIPFLVSVVLLAVGWFIRVRVPESPIFERMKSSNERLKVPFFAVLKRHRTATLRVIGARLAETTWFYTVVTFSLAYATNQLGLPKPVILNAIAAAAALTIVTIPVFGYVGDRVGQKWLYVLGVLGLVAFAFPYFTMLQSKNPGSVWLAIVVALSVVHALMYSQEATLFAGQFPAQVRYTGISLAVQVSGAVGGGLAPIVATGLLAVNGGATGYVSLYLIALGVIAFGCSATMRNEIHG